MMKTNCGCKEVIIRMKSYVALLRGINISGKNKIK